MKPDLKTIEILLESQNSRGRWSASYHDDIIIAIDLLDAYEKLKKEEIAVKIFSAAQLFMRRTRLNKLPFTFTKISLILFSIIIITTGLFIQYFTNLPDIMKIIFDISIVFILIISIKLKGMVKNARPKGYMLADLKPDAETTLLHAQLCFKIFMISYNIDDYLEGAVSLMIVEKKMHAETEMLNKTKQLHDKCVPEVLKRWV